VRAGTWIVGAALVPLGAWMCLAPLSMAVVAPGFVKVDLNRRPVQHLEGGIVRAVLVRDGQRVKAGDAVLVLGDVAVDADRQRLRLRFSAERATLARLEAEQVLAARIAFPADLVAAGREDRRLAEALAKESALFAARRDALGSQSLLLKAQREQVQVEIAALERQIVQAQSALSLQQQDLDANRRLVRDGFISPMRLAQIESAVIDYASKLDERRSELARAGQRRLDIDLRLRTLSNDYLQAASDQLKSSSARLGEIEQDLRKSEDASARQAVTAPVSGEVIDLKFTSPGAVVRPGDAIADIVPSEATLLIEAHIRPEDVSHVRPEQNAQVKFTAYRYRSTSMLAGKVTYVSADRLVERASNTPYYSVLIAVDAEALRAAPELAVQAGMPAEVYIEGSRQTPLQYLAEPITSAVRKAARPL
jgi:HlyD family secretion protein